MKQAPSISVVISTRNRGSNVLTPVQTLMQSTYPSFEVVVVDQSDDDSTANCLKPFLPDPRFVYMRTSRIGLSIGRNLGTRAAQGAIVAVTDDDCEPASDWLQCIDAAFVMEENIGVVFGNILAGPHDSVEGMVPICDIPKPFLARSVKDRLHVEGMGACMAYRKNVWENLGGFDESLGAGTDLRAGDDGDFAVRALIAGHAIYTTPLAAIVHHGFRNWDVARHLAFDYWYGAGALHAKLLKCRRMAGITLLLRLAWRFATDSSPVAISFQPLSFRWLRLRSFSLGILAGLRKPIDSRLCLFLPSD